MKYTHLIVKESIQVSGRYTGNVAQFSKVDEPTEVVDLVSEISKSDSIRVKSIIRIYEDGSTTPMTIAYDSGKLQLIPC